MPVKLAEYKGKWTIEKIFSCKNCNGYCCHLPFIEDVVPEEDGKCIYLKDGKCSIYDKRPEICRFFPLFWNYKKGVLTVYADLRFCYNPAIIPIEDASEDEINNFKSHLEVILLDHNDKRVRKPVK